MQHFISVGRALLVLVTTCVLAAPLVAQETGSVTGRVVDETTGRPLPNARVFFEGGGEGVLTDERGRFLLLNAPAGQVRLQAEAFGYASLEQRVAVRPGEASEVALSLRAVGLRLDDIVVTGTAAGALGKQVSHSVGTIDPREIDEPIADLGQLLRGRLPGVTVQQSSAMSGAGSQIRLRGNVSAALSNEPLVYVDGIRVRSDGYPENLPKVGDFRLGPNETPSPLNDINPADIERIEVVKGPAATTLYGAEAASGVIQIFTKRGRVGAPVWSAEFGQGFDRVLEYGTAGDPYIGMDRWLDRSAWRQRYSLSVAGGGELRYFLSGSFDRNDGVLPNDRENRMTLRANIDGEPREDLSLRLSTSHTVHDIRNTPSGNTSAALTFNVYREPFTFVGDTTRASLSRLLDFEIDTEIDHTIVALNAVHTPTSAWTNRVTVGYDRAAARLRQLRPYGYIFAPEGALSDEDWVNGILTAEYVGSIDLAPTRDLTTKLSWGAQSVTSTVTSDAGYAEAFEEGEEPTVDGGALSLDYHSKVRVRTTGAFAEALVGYRDRYFLTGGVRVDGSTAFGDELGLQTYPRVGASYVVSEEAFWPEALGTVKLRASYGHAGRAPGVIDELRTWHLTDYDGDEAVVPGAIGNPELAPERTAEIELGIEGAFFDDRVVAEFSWYRQETRDALFPVTPIPSEGFTQIQLVNIGTLENRGVELSLSANVLAGERLGWDAGFYLATNHSELVDLGGAPPLRVFDAGWMIEGAPVPTLIAPKVLNPDEIADPIIDEDHVWGANIPTLVWGVLSTVRLPWDVELDARGEFMGGHYTYDNIGNSMARRDVYPPCAPAYALRAEGRADELTAWQRVWCIARNVPNDGGPLYPADFFRIRELTLRAPVPSVVFGDVDATVSLSARNFWTWKNEDFLLFDPEMVGPDGMHTLVRRIDPHVPPPATFTLSVKVTR